MARYALIDGYLDTMRSEIRWRRDLDDLVSEMEDHLYSTVEDLLATGVGAKAAQRTTLDRFGEPKVLAAVYASTDSGGIAVPTRNTIRAGTFALAAAALWVAAAVTYALNRTVLDDWNRGIYGAYTALILAAGVLGLLAMVGASKRLGGLGKVGMIGLVITGVGVFMSLVAWALPLWMGLQGIGMLVFGTAALRRDIAPRTATLLVSSGFIIGVITYVVLTIAEFGPRDQWGDYPEAWVAGMVVGVSIAAVGLVGWGIWLRNEEPVDIDNDAPAITA
jgi:hypothetical protein